MFVYCIMMLDGYGMYCGFNGSTLGSILINLTLKPTKKNCMRSGK